MEMKSVSVPFGVITLIIWGCNIASVCSQPECRDIGVIYFCTGSADDVFDIGDVPNKATRTLMNFQGHRVTGFTNENLREFTSLATLTLDSNTISSSFFEDGVFSGVNLTELTIRNNEIVFDEHFAGVVNQLDRLETLQLSGNPGITTFHPDAITTFDRLSSFSFTEATIECDCELSWFRNYLINRPDPFEVTTIMCPSIGLTEEEITRSNFCSASGHITTGENLVCLKCEAATNRECNDIATNETCADMVDPYCVNTISLGRNDMKLVTKGCAGSCNNQANGGRCFGENPNFNCLFCCRGPHCNRPETSVLEGYYPPGYPFEPEIFTTTPIPVTTTAVVTTETITTAVPTTLAPTTLAPTTLAPTTLAPTTLAPTTLAPTTLAPTTLAPTTLAPTTLAPTTLAPTTLAPTTLTPTTLAPTTLAPTTLAPTTVAPTTLAPTTKIVTTMRTTPLQTTAPTTSLPTTESTTLPTVLTTDATTKLLTTMSTTQATTTPLTTEMTTAPGSTAHMTPLLTTTPFATTTVPTTLLTTTMPTTPSTAPMTTPDLTTEIISTIASSEVPTTPPLTTKFTPQMTTVAATTPRLTTDPTTEATTTLRPTTVAETTERTTTSVIAAATTTERLTTSKSSTEHSSTIATTPITGALTTATSRASPTDGVTTGATTTVTLTTTTELDRTTPDGTLTYCTEEENETDYGEVEWPRTESGATATVECPVHGHGEGDVRKNATRVCGQSNLLFNNRSGNEMTDFILIWERPREDRNVTLWKEANYTMCQTVHEGLQMLASENITAENVVVITNDLVELTDVTATLNETDVENAVIVLEGAVTSIEVPGQNETEEVLENIIETVEHLSQVEDEQLLLAQQNANTSVRIIEAIEETVMTVEIEGDAFSSSSEVLDVAILKLGEDRTRNITFPAQERKSEKDDDEEEGDEGKSSPKTVVTIPSTALKDAPRVQFLLYKDTSLFETITRTNKTGGDKDCPTDEACLSRAGALGSLVISASLGDTKVTNLKEPIVTTFYHSVGTGENEVGNNSQCVFWDFEADNGRGDWSTKGCRVAMETDNFTTCHCDHLTNFAVLLDIYQNVEDIPERHARIITYISIGGATLSFVSLVLALASYSCAGKLRADKRVKVLLNLMVALLLMNMAFLFDVMVSEFGNQSSYLCLGAAVAMHLSLLCVMTWMALEAFTMYLALVRVFDSRRSHFMLKMFFIGWGIPFLIVGASVGINREHYGYFNNLCYLDTIPFYITFFVPVCMVLMWNSIVYVLVIRQMYLLRRRQTEWNQTFSLQDQLKASFSLTFLLGLTWLFAFFAFGELNVVFSYLFAIFNTLQGFIVFLFHCVLKREIRRQWQALCCPCIPLLKEGEDGTYSRSRSGTNSSNNTLIARRNLLRNEVQLREHGAATDTRSRSWFWQRRRSDVESTSTNMTRISAAASDSSPASTLNRFPRDIDFSPASTINGRHIPIEDAAF